jgi:hypothetical protein
VDNQVAEPEVDHVELEANHAKPEADLARKVGQESEKGDNKEEGDAEPSIVTPIVNEPFRLFVPKVPYPERLQAPKKGGKLGGVQTSPN